MIIDRRLNPESGQPGTIYFISWVFNQRQAWEQKQQKSWSRLNCPVEKPIVSINYHLFKYFLPKVALDKKSLKVKGSLIAN